MIDKLEQLRERFDQLNKLIMDPDLPKDQKRYREVMQEHSALTETMQVYDQYRETLDSISETRELLEHESDASMKEMARDELHELEEKSSRLGKELRHLLVPKDPLDTKNAIMEIRAGTGGDEAALFAADLYRMYQRLCETRGWKIEVMNSNPTEIGGYKEIVYSVSGKGVFGELKYESGVHRVQRVPETESGGRIHTSAVTVAVLPEAEESDVQVNQEDLRIDVYRSSGPGGQSVNTTDSAVRITHIPTGLVVICQDEKSQLKNKAKALRVLKARLYEMEENRRQQEEAAARRSQIGSGDRSERIRTYNFPQNRFTDHRINLTLYRLDAIMQGELDEAIETLKITDREAYLKEHV
ncbi:MAG TPA: peptide chain release factor 1 [Spirochaetia bacterium]|nr:peptide chain release factor 1 [Spirochaetia bacterium]